MKWSDLNWGKIPPPQNDLLFSWICMGIARRSSPFVWCSRLTFVLACVPCWHILYLEHSHYLHPFLSFFWLSIRIYLPSSLCSCMSWSFGPIYIDVIQPTFRVQRLSFAFFKETKRSSEMNVSSSTWRQRQWCWRCEKNHMKILTTQPKTPKLNALILLTVIMWLSLPRTQDTDLRKAKLSYVVLELSGIICWYPGLNHLSNDVREFFRTFRYYHVLISRTRLYYVVR